MASAASARAATAADDALAAFGAIVLDPVAFSTAVLRHDPWSIEAAILRSIATKPRTAVKACHASGKTFTAADAVIWWVSRYDDGVVVTTAPTWTQVERLLWGEIHKSTARAQIQFPKLHKTELALSPENYAIGLSTNEGVRFQGWHGRILIVLDEAPGVLPDIYDAIEGIRAGGHVHVLMLGNPIVAGGPFFDAFNSNAARWNRITISAFDTPNLAGVTLEQLLAMGEAELDVAPRPYLVSRRWVREKYDEWGPGHPLWEAKVLGQFPTQSEDALIPLGWVEEAFAPKGGGATDYEAGVDVAGPGEDETVLCVRRGADVVLLKWWSDRDPRGKVAAALAPYRGLGSKPLRVKVDSVGMGYYFAQHLKDQGFAVEEVNVGDAARDDEKYRYRKAELYWGLRQRFEQRAVGGITDPTLIAQLTGLRYGHTARGQVEVESKDAARKRGIKSPDRAEALMLAFAPPYVITRDLNPRHFKRVYG